MSKEITLASLAMLKVNINEGGDYLAYLQPFILHILTLQDRNTAITDENMRTEFIREFGLSIPRRTLQIVLRRLVKKRFLKSENNSYTIVANIPKDNNLQQRRAESKRRINSVAIALIHHAKKAHGIEITEENAIEAMSAFLSQFSINCIKSYLQGTAFPEYSIVPDNFIHLVSSFVKEINSCDQDCFDNFMVVLQGNMLANALLCPDMADNPGTFSKTTFYFDTPLLLQLLGLKDKNREEATMELVKLLKNLNAEISYFSHTLEEVENVIRRSADYLGTPEGIGSIIAEAKNRELNKSDLILISESARESFDKLGLNCNNTPPYLTEFQIDETVFESSLAEEISYHNPRAMHYDINSVRSIYVLRKGEIPRSIEKSKAIFVTSNTSFAKEAFEYGKENDRTMFVSSVISDFTLANIAWLKAPLAAPSLPRKEVLSFSYAALCPTQDFLKKVLVEAEKLEKSGKISARDHQILRSDQNIIKELYDITLGEEKALTEQPLLAVLENCKNDIKKEELEKLNAEKKIREQRENELADEREQREKIIQNIYLNSDKTAKIISWILFVIILSLLVLSTVAGSIKIENTVCQFTIWMFLFLFLLIWATFEWVIGIPPLIDIKEKTRIRLRNTIIKNEYRKLGIKNRYADEELNIDEISSPNH